MLDLLRAQADRLPGRAAERLTVVQGDMSAFTLPVRFGAIVLGITSIGLLDEPVGRACTGASVGTSPLPVRFS